jgi:hypothetical protein
MATQFEFKNKQDLINKINEEYGPDFVNEKTFRCSFYCYDNRINENTHIVEVYRNDKDHWVIGMADCMVNDETGFNKISEVGNEN